MNPRHIMAICRAHAQELHRRKVAILLLLGLPLAFYGLAGNDGLAIDLRALIKPLGDTHGYRRREAELAARFLLQGRGGEGRVGIALGGLRFDRSNREGCRFERAF